MEIKEGTKNVQVFVIYVERIDGERKEIELRKIVCEEDTAIVELNEILDLFHSIYRINNPFKYRRSVTANVIIYTCPDKDEPDFRFWYDVAELNLL